jgi:hypothetical protein
VVSGGIGSREQDSGSRKKKKKKPNEEKVTMSLLWAQPYCLPNRIPCPDRPTEPFVGRFPDPWISLSGPVRALEDKRYHDKLVPSDPLPGFASRDKLGGKKVGLKSGNKKEGLSRREFSPPLPPTATMDPLIFSALMIPEG